MRRFAPVLWVNARQVVTIHRLLRRCEQAEREAAKQTRRVARWRRTALEMAPRIGPRAMDVCLLQVQSDEIEDLPTVGDERCRR